MLISKKTIRVFVTVVIGWMLLSDPGLAAGSSKTEKVKTPKAPLPGLVGSTSFAGELNRNPLTVIQFWASWCTGCGTVMGQLTDVISKNPKLGYVTVSLDETKDVAMKFFSNKDVKARGALSASYLDASGSSFAEPNGVESLPYLIVVDKNGTIVKRIKGHPSKTDIDFLSKKL